MVGQTGFLIFPVAPHTLLRANRPASCRNPLTPTTNPRKEHTQIDGTHHLRRRHPHQDEAIAFTKVGKKTFEDLYGFLGYQSGQNKLFTKKELLLRFYEIKDQAKEIEQ